MKLRNKKLSIVEQVLGYVFLGLLVVYVILFDQTHYRAYGSIVSDCFH